MHARSWLTLACAAWNAGCLSGGELAPPPEEMPAVPGPARQHGDMGDIHDYAGDADVMLMSSTSASAVIRLDSVGDGWWVMSRLAILGLDLGTAAPGTYRTDDVGSAPFALSVTGCSGESYGALAFEPESPDAVITLAEHADGTRTLDYDMSFPYRGEPQVASGSFTFRPAGLVQPQDVPELAITPSVAITDATQEGSLGEIVDFRAPAIASEARYEPGYATIVLDSVGDGFWVRTHLRLARVDLATAPEGTYRTDLDDPNGVSVSVSGSSGPRYDDERFFSGADRSEITIRDNADGTRTIDVSADYSLTGRPQSTRASFRFVRP
jgi:hypothetical protein